MLNVSKQNRSTSVNTCLSSALRKATFQHSLTSAWIVCGLRCPQRYWVLKVLSLGTLVAGSVRNLLTILPRVGHLGLWTLQYSSGSSMLRRGTAVSERYMSTSSMDDSVSSVVLGLAVKKSQGSSVSGCAVVSWSSELASAPVKSSTSLNFCWRACLAALALAAELKKASLYLGSSRVATARNSVLSYGENLSSIMCNSSRRSVSSLLAFIFVTVWRSTNAVGMISEAQSLALLSRWVSVSNSFSNRQRFSASDHCWAVSTLQLGFSEAYSVMALHCSNSLSSIR